MTGKRMEEGKSADVKNYFKELEKELDEKCIQFKKKHDEL